MSRKQTYTAIHKNQWMSYPFQLLRIPGLPRLDTASRCRCGGQRILIYWTLWWRRITATGCQPWSKITQRGKPELRFCKHTWFKFFKMCSHHKTIIVFSSINFKISIHSCAPTLSTRSLCFCPDSKQRFKTLFAHLKIAFTLRTLHE